MPKYKKRVTAVEFDGSIDSVKKIVNEIMFDNDKLAIVFQETSGSVGSRHNNIHKLIINGNKYIYKNDYVAQDRTDGIKVYDHYSFYQLFGEV